MIGGRPLFRRRPRPMALTEAGSRLFPVIRDGLEVFASTIAAVKRDRSKQPLRVTTTNAFASCWLVPRLPRWRKIRPDAPLEVIGTDSVIDLNAGDADIAIRCAMARGNVRPLGLNYLLRFGPAQRARSRKTSGTAGPALPIPIGCRSPDSAASTPQRRRSCPFVATTALD